MKPLERRWISAALGLLLIGAAAGVAGERHGSPGLSPGRCGVSGGFIVQPAGALPTHVTPRAGGGYTIRTPGELPTRVLPTAGGYQIVRPGELPTRVTRTAAGGVVIYTPGELPTRVVPTAGGGYAVHTPGQLPTRVSPLAGGGYVVRAPGELPTRVVPIGRVTHPPLGPPGVQVGVCAPVRGDVQGAVVAIPVLYDGAREWTGPRLRR
jgi:hypothetical protein